VPPHVVTVGQGAAYPLGRSASGLPAQVCQSAFERHRSPLHTQPPPLEPPPLLDSKAPCSASLHQSPLSRARALRWRFWVQPYDPSYHTALTLGESVGSAILLGSPWEYDVPKCGQGVPGCSWECGTVSPGCTWVHTVTGSHMGQHTFVAFNPQCV
jgi:hypothetical protein